MQRYRYTTGSSKGQFVSREAVESITERAIDEMKQLAQQTNDLLFEGRITVAQWERDQAFAIKQVSIWQYGLGNGGVGQLDYKDYGILGAEMRAQLSYLRGFSQAILEGSLTRQQIRARLDLYFNRTFKMFERGKREGHRENGYWWERRVLGGTNNCGDCLGYEAMGWQMIGTLPLPTVDCQCKANCRCSFEYSSEISRPTD